jgi:hypothetical protein
VIFLDIPHNFVTHISFKYTLKNTPNLSRSDQQPNVKVNGVVKENLGRKVFLHLKTKPSLYSIVANLPLQLAVSGR